MITAILAVLLFILLILPHELGHFVVAKSVGVKVNEFAFGMGPALWKKQKGETQYTLRAFPIGGYCAMEGENEESDNDRAFNNKPGWAKIMVLIAGSTMNVLVTVLILTIMILYVGTATTTLGSVQDNSPAQAAGLKVGDVITEVNGNKLEEWTDLSKSISDDSTPVEITVDRNGVTKTFSITPEKGDDGRYVIGVNCKVKHNPGTAFTGGWKATWSLTTSMYTSLKQLATGQISANEVSGPVGMVTLVSETTTKGLWYFAYLVALISLNLAIINMLPLPALDGGRILFVIIRKCTGKMISDQLEGRIHAAGMMLLLGLMVLVTWNDIGRLIS